MQRKYEYRRKLPHYQPDFKAFFITFSTYHRWVLPESVRQIVIDTCLAGNGTKFRLYAVVVMPDHVHMVLAPQYDANGSVSIAEIMQAIKGASAHRINKLLGRKGKVWEEESFDRALRQEESIDDKVDYIPGGSWARWKPAGISLALAGHERHGCLSFSQRSDGRGRPSSTKCRFPGAPLFLAAGFL